MDDVAASLKMSKRTLYETYHNKEELLVDVLKDGIRENHTHMEEFKENCDDVMDMLVEFFRLQLDTYTSTNPQFFKDLKNYPSLFDKFRGIQEENQKNSTEFFRRGMEEGYFRKEINYEFVSKVGRQCSMAFRTEQMFSKYDMHDIFVSFVLTLIRGICTEKGTRKIDAFMDKYLEGIQK